MLHGQNPVEIQIRFDQREFYRVRRAIFVSLGHEGSLTRTQHSQLFGFLPLPEGKTSA
jgi:hypothetical protein